MPTLSLTQTLTQTEDKHYFASRGKIATSQVDPVKIKKVLKKDATFSIGGCIKILIPVPNLKGSDYLSISPKIFNLKRIKREWEIFIRAFFICFFRG